MFITGRWILNVIRTPEYRLFEFGDIPGTQYIYGSGTAVDSVILFPLVNIARTGGDVYPVEEDQTESIQRPLRYVKDT